MLLCHRSIRKNFLIKVLSVQSRKEAYDTAWCDSCGVKEKKVGGQRRKKKKIKKQKIKIWKEDVSEERKKKKGRRRTGR